MPLFNELVSPGAMHYNTETLGRWFNLTDAATIATNVSVSDFFYVTLGGNRTLGAPTNPPAAANLWKKGLLYRIRQDGTGGRTLAYNAIFRFPSGVTPILSTGINKTDYLAFMFNEIDTKWDLIGLSQNF